MQTVPLTNNFGIEVQGLDLARELPATQQDMLRTMLHKHQVLLFRKQALDDKAQIRVLGYFGTVCDEHGDGSYHSYVSNVRANTIVAQGPLLFHQDYVYTQWPLPVQSLYGQEIGGPGVPTTLASCTSAYAKLPSELREQADRLSAVHCVDYSQERKNPPDRVRLLEHNPSLPSTSFPRTTHPVSKVHPVTGDPMLFVSEYFTSHINQLPAQEGEELLQRFFGFLYDPANVYTHNWAEGDLLVWDALAVQHGRASFGQNSRRTLRRVVVSERPISDLFIGVDRTDAFYEFDTKGEKRKLKTHI